MLPAQTWVIDSGATHHVSHDRHNFVSLESSVMSCVNLPNGSMVKISEVGVVQINEHLSLQRVLYIPEFKLNLLSISALTSDIGSRVICDPSSCMIQDHTRAVMIGQCKRVGNLYVLDTRSSLMAINAVVDVGVWHKRLGHPSYHCLDSISEQLGTAKHKNKGSSFCHTCHLAKQKKLSYPSPNNMCNQILQLLHIDIWGPFSVETFEGYRYFLTVVDDHSRATWIFLLRNKSDVITVFPNFIQQVELQ